MALIGGLTKGNRSEKYSVLVIGIYEAYAGIYSMIRNMK